LILLGFFQPLLAESFTFLVPLLALALMMDRFLLSVPPQNLVLSRAVNPKWSIGQPNVIQISLINNSEQPLRGEIADSIPQGLLAGQHLPVVPFSAAPYAHEVLTIPLKPKRRGAYAFGKIHLRYRSRLGLLWIRIQGGRAETVKVTADLRRLQRMRIQASRALSAGEMQKRTLGLEGTQFSGLRHYFAGDDVRKMAWQATAKRDLPVVRTFEPEVEQPILVLLDAGRKMEAVTAGLQKYDWALNTALAFMAVALDRGDCVGAGVFSNRVMAHVPLGMGKSHLNRLLETLGETAVEPVEPDYETVMLQFARRLKRRTLVVILTDLIDPPASRHLLRSLEFFPANHLLMLVALADTDTQALADALPADAYEAYRKGVALDLLEERRRALAVLSGTRQAVVVDAPPERLDETLIQRYLSLKRQNRL
jgi:uncharacterized protein (DUF58 family)